MYLSPLSKDGAKMFYFGGVVNGKYLKHEVKQLTLLLGRVKYRPLIWRNTHPYVVVDRHEDITHPSKIEEAIRENFKNKFEIDDIVYVNPVYDIADFYKIFNKQNELIKL